MTRKEEIEQQTFVYYETCSDEDIAKSEGFIKGAEWADQNPRKGLWDSEKVCAWIGNHLLTSHQGYILEDLRKAMKENNGR